MCDIFNAVCGRCIKVHSNTGFSSPFQYSCVSYISLTSHRGGITPITFPKLQAQHFRSSLPLLQHFKKIYPVALQAFNATKYLVKTSLFHKLRKNAFYLTKHFPRIPYAHGEMPPTAAWFISLLIWTRSFHNSLRQSATNKNVARRRLDLSQENIIYECRNNWAVSAALYRLISLTVAKQWLWWIVLIN